MNGEQVYDQIIHVLEARHEINKKVAIEMKEQYDEDTFARGMAEASEQILQAVKRMKQFYKQDLIHDECPHCGTTELLCGYNGSGCQHEDMMEDE